MEKILINYDQAEAEKQISKLAKIKDQLQGVVTAFTGLEDQLKELAPAFKLKDGFSLSIEELQTLYQGTNFSSLIPNEKAIEQLMLRKIFPDGTHEGLPVRFDRISEFVVTPEISGVVAAIKRTDASAMTFIQQGYFQLKKNKVSIATGTEESINESFKIYAETAVEVERFQRAKVLADAVTAIEQNLEPGESLFDLGDLERIIEPLNGVYVASASYCKYGATGRYFSPAVPQKEGKKKEPAPPLWEGIELSEPEPNQE